MDKKEYDVIVSDAALAMLDSHVDFLARVSVNAATRLMNEILDDIESLANNPQRYPAYENPFIPVNRYRRMLSCKRYLILYEIDTAAVFVDYIVDCRSDYDWLIR
jgi:plasmid stabilization system protein ParE